VTTFREYLAGRPAGEELLANYLSALGEWRKSEFKAAAEAGDAVIRSAVCAIANTEGGEVFVGVSDDGKTPGTSMSEQQVSQLLRQAHAPPGNWYVVDLTRVVHSILAVPVGSESGGKRVHVLEIRRPGMPVFVREDDGSLAFYYRQGESSRRANSFEALEWNRRIVREDMLRTCYLELKTLAKVVGENYPGLALGLGLRLPYMMRRLEDGSFYQAMTDEDLLFILGEATGSGYRGGVVRAVFEMRYRLEQQLQRSGMDTVAAFEESRNILRNAAETLSNCADSFRNYLGRQGIVVE